MADPRIPKQFSQSQLEELLDTVFEDAVFPLDSKTRSRCAKVAGRYNSKTGELAVNALSAMSYSVQKDAKTLKGILEELEGYKFPVPKIKETEDTKYMHPQLKAAIVRHSDGITHDDMEFFKGIYAKLGVRRQRA